MDNRPLITLLCTRFWPDRHGGLEQKMWRVAQSLARLGSNVHVLTENRTGASAKEYLSTNQFIERLAPMDPGRLWRWRELVGIRWWRHAIRKHAGSGLIWANDPMMCLGAILAGRRDDLVYFPIGCAAQMNRVARIYPQVDSLRTTAVLRKLDRLAYRFAPRVVFESDNARRQFQDCYGRRHGVKVIHNGTPPAEPIHRAQARRRFGLGVDDWVVGYVGRLDPCKGLDFLFKSEACNSGTESSRLLIVGSGPDRERLVRTASHLGISGRITWVDQLDSPGVAYAAMDAMVLPSVYEIFGNVILEAMAHGVPVIGRRRDTNPRRPVLTANDELIGHGTTGLLTAPHKPRDLRRLLNVLRMFPGTRATMARQARAFAMRQTWERAIGHTFEFIGNADQAMGLPLRRAA